MKLGVSREHAHYVVVHNVGEEEEEEDETDRDEAFFEGHAEVATHAALYGEEQNIAAVENRDGQKIQDAKINADEHHERKNRERAFAHGLTRSAGNADRALQLLDGDAPAEEPADDAECFRDALAGHDK